MSAESVGAVIGAVVGSTATALLSSPEKGKNKLAAGLEAGAKAAGAIAVGQMGLLAGEAIGTAMNAVNGAQAKAGEWLAQDERDRAMLDEEESQSLTSDHSQAR